MKTVIIDNSLCTLPIAEGTSPELICRYIHALAETGVPRRAWDIVPDDNQRAGSAENPCGVR